MRLELLPGKDRQETGFVSRIFRLTARHDSLLKNNF